MVESAKLVEAALVINFSVEVKTVIVNRSATMICVRTARR